MSSAVREHIAALATLLAEVSDPTQFAAQATPVLAALRTLYPSTLQDHPLPVRIAATFAGQNPRKG